MLIYESKTWVESSTHPILPFFPLSIFCLLPDRYAHRFTSSSPLWSLQLQFRMESVLAQSPTYLAAR